MPIGLSVGAIECSVKYREYSLEDIKPPIKSRECSIESVGYSAKAIGLSIGATECSVDSGEYPIASIECSIAPIGVSFGTRERATQSRECSVDSRECSIEPIGLSVDIIECSVKGVECFTGIVGTWADWVEGISGKIQTTMPPIRRTVLLKAKLYSFTNKLWSIKLNGYILFKAGNNMLFVIYKHSKITILRFTNNYPKGWVS